MEKHYDVVIGGAGPAGLALSKELSKHFDVLVLEKGHIGKSTKSWYTYMDRVKKHKLQDAVTSKCNQVEFRTIYNHHFMKDKCAVVDKDIVLQKWISENKSEIKKEAITNVTKPAKGIISVKTDKDKYTAPLFVDCMGAASPLLNNSTNVDFSLLWNCYGYKLGNIKPPEHVQFLPLNDNKNTYVFVYKTGPKEADVVLFCNTDKNVNPAVLLSRKYNAFQKKFCKGSKRLEKLHGNIMTGKLKRHALDNLLFYGDAGMFTPASCGMGFNQCLQTYPAIAKGLKEKLDKGTLSNRQLFNVRTSAISEMAMDFMQIVIKVGYYNNTQIGWSHGVDWLNEMGPISKYWMRNEVSAAWARKSLKKFYKTNSIVDIARSVPPKEYYFIVKASARILKNFTIHEAKHIFFKYNPRAINKRLLAKLFSGKKK